MRTQIKIHRSRSGSVLMIALVTGGVLGVSMLSYFLLMNHQNTMVHRGQAWNHALTMAEAGVEDALAHLNIDFGTNNPFGNPSQGWSGPVAGPAALDDERSLAGGRYSVLIERAAGTGFPIITSNGKVKVPNSSQFVERQVQVRCVPKAAYQSAMVVRKDITFNGNNITTDSYDSTSNFYSTSNRYDQLKRKAGGDIVSTEGFINVGNADIKGKLYTGPINAGQYSVGPGGSVGDLNWNGPGIQPGGWYFNDFNADFTPVGVPDSKPEASSWALSTIASGSGSKPKTNFLQGGYAYLHAGELKLTKTTDRIVVTGDAKLYVTGNISIAGQIVVEPGATLKLYAAGASSQFKIVNAAGVASAFQYYGLPSNTQITWTGNSEFIGVVYAPNANLKLSGGGSGALGNDFQGSMVVNAISLVGNFSFHFDEALKKIIPSGWVVTRWEEL